MESIKYQCYHKPNFPLWEQTSQKSKIYATKSNQESRVSPKETENTKLSTYESDTGATNQNSQINPQIHHSNSYQVLEKEDPEEQPYLNEVNSSNYYNSKSKTTNKCKNKEATKIRSKQTKTINGKTSKKKIK